MEKKIKAKIYKGMTGPTVEIPEDELAQASGAVCVPSKEQAIHVSLESLKTDLHNQSYGMACGSTGCISNPGGPGC